MARRVSVSQLRSQIQRAASKRRQATGDYNRAVRKFNQDRDRAVNKYNQEVRSHNARVRAHRARLNQALSRLQSHAIGVRFQHFSRSVHSLHTAYVRLESCYAEPQTPARENLLDLSERETANSIEVVNVLLAENPSVTPGEATESLQATGISDELAEFSADLDARWRGALFALNPRNPDAARHFCTSAREIVDGVLDIAAPDQAVIAAVPACDKTPQGSPTRRARIRFLLQRREVPEPEAEEFVAQDIDNVVDLFRVFNDGTHGRAGHFVLQELVTVKRRVEDGVHFLMSIVR